MKVIGWTPDEGAQIFYDTAVGGIHGHPAGSRAGATSMR